MIRGVTFDKQVLKSQDHAHEVNYFYQGDMGVTKGCEVTENGDGNLVVADGYFIIHGRLLANDGDEVVVVPDILSGTKYSILVFEIDLTQTNTISSFAQGVFKILESDSVYPTLTQQDLNDGGTLYQMEFARFTNSVSGIASLSEANKPILVWTNQTIYNVTIPSASWTGSSAPYSKAVTVSGLLSTNKPIIDLVLSGTYATDVTMRTNWGLIYRGVTSTDTITFYADSVPSADINIQLLVVR
jgi:hypothetical protein